ncbi:MAG: hypothetical protein N2691_05615 [Patescibacteria group bacterium]|nr:hypothetical protein [Patescibacteria group bacterium]
MKVRLIIVATLFFVAGFFFHALFFPYLFVDGDLSEAQKAVQSVLVDSTYEDERNDFITYVNYENGRFRPASVEIKRGNYIAITNRDTEERMHLDSPRTQLSTVRPYALGERVKTTLSEPGSFTVTNRENPRAVLKITVK